MKTQIITIHGGETFGSYEAYISWLESFKLDFDMMGMKGWKDTLGEKLGNDFEVLNLRMPNSMNAKYLEWKIWFEKFIPYFNESAIFIGHSLGGIFLAKYFSENDYPKGIKSIKAIFMLAAPYGPINDQDNLADFILSKDLNGLDRLAAYGDKVHLYYSKNDTVVPFSDLARYQKRLPEAKVRIFEDKGHFRIAELPELIDDIQVLR